MTYAKDKYWLVEYRRYCQSGKWVEHCRTECKSAGDALALCGAANSESKTNDVMYKAEVTE